MIVKFDHLTFAANRKNVEDIIKQYSKVGYHLTLVEEQATNMPTKLAYMKHKDSTHGLHFMAPPAEGGIPVEIVSYDNTTKGNCYIDYTPKLLSFQLKSSNPDSCKQLLLALGCEDSGNNMIKLQGALDEYPINIDITEAKDLSLNLDNEGICCPTIFVRPLGKHKKKIEEAGFKCSEVETFEVEGASFYVFFAEGKGGEILEITSNKL